ncbi:unnamed protein product [Citrullus colocynthis]|uniref:G domain-containing protein n=1 Tax=Citrullus colocynthis TaxID=252529 RepID=A0ABP0XUC5_9ROSI
MGKNDKMGLGRALVKQHNQMIQQSEEKGRIYRSQQKKVLESVTEVSDMDAVIQQADEVERLFSIDNPTPNFLINLDGSSSIREMTSLERREQQKIEEALHASSLRVPRSLARLEENENLVLTPFEKNLDIWRQLWRVVERCDLLVMVVDARDPLFYRCPDLEAYAREVDQHKRTMLLVNKADLLPYSVRKKWAEFFNQHEILYLFWSAKAASAALEGKKLSSRWNTNEPQNGVDDPDTKIYARDELLSRLQYEAEQIVERRTTSSTNSSSQSDNLSLRGSMNEKSSGRVMVGFVGYPNVGKSSTINALVGQKRAGVTSTPGKTKHFQTLIISM